jgi:hypothetical protein
MNEALSISSDTLKTIREFNRNVEWLKTQSVKTRVDKWGSYEEACKILDRSKQWYKIARLGRIANDEYTTAPALLKGSDWRMSGNEIEYRLGAIEQLKERIAS